MPKPERKDARRDYRHFPREYTDLLVQFDRDGRVVMSFSGDTARRDAEAARRDFYRFKTFVSAGVDADPTDAHARSLMDIFNRILARIVTSPSGVALILDSNPIVRAMRAVVPTARPGAPSAALPDARSCNCPAGSGEAGGVFRAVRNHDGTHAWLTCPDHTSCRSAHPFSPAFCECGDEAEGEQPL